MSKSKRNVSEMPTRLTINFDFGNQIIEEAQELTEKAEDFLKCNKSALLFYKKMQIFNMDMYALFKKDPKEANLKLAIIAKTEFGKDISAEVDHKVKEKYQTTKSTNVTE